MNITGAMGLTEAQKMTLKALRQLTQVWLNTHSYGRRGESRKVKGIRPLAEFPLSYYFQLIVLNPGKQIDSQTKSLPSIAITA